MSKPIVAACAMSLVEDNTVRLDDPVDDLLPELADMRLLAAPRAALDAPSRRARSITVRDSLTYTIGTGMVLAEPGTVPIVATCPQASVNFRQTNGSADSVRSRWSTNPANVGSITPPARSPGY